MPPSAEIAAVARVQARHSPALRARPNVIGTATGPKIAGGRPTGDLAVKVYVERKLPGLDEPDAVPRFVDGVPTDVIECGPARALGGGLSAYRMRHRPVLGGCGISHPGSDGGTVAAVCADARTGRPYLLSNHHVLVMAPTSRLRNRVLQPGLGDGGDPGSDMVGRLARAAPLRPGAANRVDAAVARLAPGIAFDQEILGLGAVRGTAPAATLGQRVRKSGRTTGTTAGRVLDVNADILVEVHDRPIRFTGQLVIDLPAGPGDSGSLVLTGDNAALGLLFAGTSAFVLANPISAVLTALRVVLPAPGG